MADNEKKTAEIKAAEKPAKAKEGKPSFFKRAIAWLKTVRAECKKVTWANWESVKQNSIVVIVVTIVFAIFLGILDYVFSNAIVGLSRVL
ncbi:MAG: preprotein translocase subunit SecE [Clostridia bacterium]|nr:preprotein translocase subunit SecE [Clostridia bacterium]